MDGGGRDDAVADSRKRWRMLAPIDDVFEQKAPMMRTLKGRSERTASSIEMRLTHDVEMVLEKLCAELDAAVRSGLASAAPTAQTGSGASTARTKTNRELIFSAKELL